MSRPTPRDMNQSARAATERGWLARRSGPLLHPLLPQPPTHLHNSDSTPARPQWQSTGGRSGKTHLQRQTRWGIYCLLLPASFLITASILVSAKMSEMMLLTSPTTTAAQGPSLTQPLAHFIIFPTLITTQLVTFSLLCLFSVPLSRVVGGNFAWQLKQCQL